MKNFINFFLRFLVGVIVGGSLLFGQDSATLLLKSIGFLFIVSSVCTIGAYCWRNFRGSKEIAPLSGYAAGLMGLLMFFRPNGFQTFVPILLGLLLFLLSLYQLYLLICLRIKKHQVYFLFYVVSLLSVFYGAALVYTTEVEVLVSLRSLRDVFRATFCSYGGVGTAFIVYAVTELIIAMKYFQPMFIEKKSDIISEQSTQSEQLPANETKTSDKDIQTTDSINK